MRLRSLYVTQGVSPDTTHGVFGARHGLQVTRVHAGMDSAEVVDFQAGRDRPDEHLVGESMRQELLRFPSEPPVSVVVEPHRPNPTASRVDLDASQDAIPPRVDHSECLAMS